MSHNTGAELYVAPPLNHRESPPCHTERRNATLEGMYIAYQEFKQGAIRVAGKILGDYDQTLAHTTALPAYAGIARGALALGAHAFQPIKS